MDLELIFLCLASFMAGFVDSIVGGGGLIQLPAFMMILPQYPVMTLLGTNKLVSMTGTAFSAYQFSKKISFHKKLILPAIITAFLFSLLGAWTVSVFSNQFLRPLFMGLLFAVFLFSLKYKNFGLVDRHDMNQPQLWKPILIGSSLGFYDGFFGPGTGTFLIISLVGLVGMSLVQASAHAKLINLTTNLAAIILFSFKGEFLFSYALPMILFNVLGAMLGVKLALLRGNTFVRGLLRMIILLTILKLGHQIFIETL